VIASFGAFLAFLDATIVNVAFPSIRASFPDSSISALSWVLNAYNIVFAASLVICGRLTDLLGRRRSFVGGVLLFTLASLWCGLAPSLDVLIAARMVQALGAALLVPASLALVVEAFPSGHRAHAIGLWGATAAAAAGLGPPIGGALVELGGWRWAFLVNVPFGLAAVVAGHRQLVESRAPGRRSLPDLRGAILLAGSLALLNLALVQGGDWGWASLGVLGSFAGALVLGLGFVASSRRHRHPLLDPALLRLPSFGVATTATALAGLGFYAYLLTNVLWLRYVWGYSVLRAGLALVPGAVVAAVVAAVLGPLAARRGYRVVVVPGALVWAAAYLWYHQQVGATPAFWAEWLPGQVLSGIGVGATLPVLASAALAAVPGGRYATASAVVSGARQVGGVLGVALLVVLIGDPTSGAVSGVLRDGWLLSILAFLAVAFLAIPIGRVANAVEDEDVPLGDPLVHLPDPPDTKPVAAPSADDLDAGPVLAALAPDARAALAEASRVVGVHAGDWLLRAGDPPGSAYVVRSGRFEVEVDGHVVRELGPASVFGELALLTGERRSAGVRARRDSTVLEIPRAEFDRLLAIDGPSTRAVLTQVAGQLSSVRRPAGPPPAVAPVVVAVVPAHPGAPTASVAAALLPLLRRHLPVVAPGLVDAEGLERAEREARRVLLVAESTDPTTWQEFCRRQADAVVLVACSGEEAPAGEPGAVEPPSRRPDVVLVGPDPGPDARVAWAGTTDAWQVTVADSDLAVALRPLADRLAGRALGLVLAGGGARAFAHIGVLQELAAGGVLVDRVAGSSVGAIIAAIYAGGADPDELEAVCYSEFVRRRPFSDWTLPAVSLARGRRVRVGLARAFGPATVLEGLPRQLHVVSTDLVRRARVVHRRGDLVDAVTASARLPILFAPMARDGRLLVDGGILDNLPVDLLTERAEGPVLAVNVSAGGGGSRTDGRVRVPALGDTLLRTMMIGSGGAVEAAVAHGAAVVTPAARGVGLLEFHQFDRMVTAGRTAGRAFLDQGGVDWLSHRADTVHLEPEVILPTPRGHRVAQT
jgi:EmrB/QacA subfamily drug resistance transporter